jgi:DNA-binding transcriptional LysR family regulator
MDRIAELEALVLVVKTGGFSSAAKELNISKSQVSKLVRALEDRLGVRLLDRTTRQVAATEEGRALAERAEQLLAELAEAEEAAAATRAAPRGTLRMSVPVSFGVKYVMPAVGQFMRLYPELSVDVSLTDRRADLLEEGLDLAIRVGALADSSIIARKLCTSRRIVAASPDYLKRRGVPRRPEDLAQHDCLLYTYQVDGQQWRFMRDEEEVVVRVGGPLVCNHGEAMLEIAAAGIGVVSLPDFIAEEAIADGRLVEILEGWSDGSGAIWALYPHSRYLSARVRLFVEFFADYLTKQRAPKPAAKPRRGRKKAAEDGASEHP